jgi:hypothetical protein
MPGGWSTSAPHVAAAHGLGGMSGSAPSTGRLLSRAARRDHWRRCRSAACRAGRGRRLATGRQPPPTRARAMRIRSAARGTRAGAEDRRNGDPPAAIMVSQVTTGDHSERADGGQRARLGTTKGVLAVAVEHPLALRSSRQADVTREGVARPCVQLAPVVVTIAAVGTAAAPRLGVLACRSSSRESWSRGSKSNMLTSHNRERSFRRRSTVGELRAGKSEREGVGSRPASSSSDSIRRPISLRTTVET